MRGLAHLTAVKLKQVSLGSRFRACSFEKERGWGRKRDVVSKPSIYGVRNPPTVMRIYESGTCTWCEFCTRLEPFWFVLKVFSVMPT